MIIETVRESGRGLSCCSPVLPADTPAKRRVDHLLPRRGWPSVVYFATVIGLLGLAQALRAPPTS